MALTVGVESGLRDVVKSLRKNGISKEDTRLLYNRSKEDAEAVFKGSNNRKMSTLRNMQQYAMELEAVENSYGKEELSEARDNLIKRIHGAKQQVTTGEVKKHSPIEAKKEDSFLSAEAKEEKIAEQAQIRENVEKNIAETREAVAKDGRTEQVSGGSFNSYQTQYLKDNEGSKSKIWHANNVGQKAKNYFTELEVLEKNGADESAKIALARKHGFEPTAGGNFTEMGNAHFRKQLDADPSLWEKAMAHNVPAKATALGLTGGAVLAMANSRGQKSNAELYGV